MNWLDEKLNTQQKTAVTATEGYNRIIAGAGTGKTRVLVYKYAFLVSELGIDPKNILAVTFTNKAAAEMKKRARKLLGDKVLENGLFCTFHGFCAKVLREDGVNLGWPENFSIIDELDRKEMIKDIIEEQSYRKKYEHLHIDKVMSYIEMMKDCHNGTVIDGLVFDNFECLENEYDDIYKNYLKKQKQQYVMDYSDLMTLVLHLFSTNEKILNKWQKRLIYILVDEYQDTSSSQNTLLDMLQEYHKNLTVVGDPDQNIYSWRGAKVEYILNFDKKYIPTQDTYITLNYRSTPPILSNANSLIKNNKLRLEKELIPTIENGEKVIHFYAKSEKEEAEFVCNEIKKMIDSGILLRNITVLYRASYLSRSIEQELIRAGIKYKVYSGIRFFQREEIKDIIAYLKILDSEVIDDLSLMRVINKPIRNLSLKKIKEIKEYSESMGISCFEIIKTNSTYKTEEVNNLFKTINTFKNKKNTYKTIWELTKEYLDAIGYIKYREELNEEERLENISEMMDSIRLYEEENRYENISLSSYLQEISLYTAADDIKEIDSVSLMTIHTAKGLEFDIIFSIGWNDGILPSKKTLEQYKELGLEEERRLAYVAMTRAKKRLFISNSNYSARNICTPSRFLIELNEEMLERKNCTLENLTEEIKANIENDYESIDLEKNSISKISIGDYVNHNFFGKGRIEEMDETTIYIEFKKDKGKLKPVLKTFKGLEIIEKKEYENEDDLILF